MAGAALALFSVACRGPSKTLNPTACADTAFDPSPGLPEVVDHGSPVLASPRLVTITFADFIDSDRDRIEAYGDWIVGSDWLSAVGRDYGVGRGSHRAKVRLADPAATTLSDADIQSFLLAQIAAGVLPEPTGHDDLYMLYYPTTTAITSGEGTSCIDFSGYHGEVQTADRHFAYAVVKECSSDQDSLSLLDRMLRTASHELIEAATDPYPFSAPGYRIGIQLTPRSPWELLTENEVADLCGSNQIEYVDPTTGTTFPAQRIWSNTAASQGPDPCVPAVPGVPFFTVRIDPPSIQRVEPGTSITFTLTGQVTPPAVAADGGPSPPNPAPAAIALPNFALQVEFSHGDFTPLIDDPQLKTRIPMERRRAAAVPSFPVLNDGQTATLVLAVPDDAPRGGFASVLVHARLREQASFRPIAVCVP